MEQLVWKPDEKYNLRRKSSFRLNSNGQQLKIRVSGRCDIHNYIEIMNLNNKTTLNVYHSVVDVATGTPVIRQWTELRPYEKKGSDLMRTHFKVKKGQKLQVIINTFSAVYSFGKGTFFEITCYPNKEFRFH